MVSVRRFGILPIGALLSSAIRLPSDSASRRTPLPSANASCYRARSGLSPPSYRPCRAHQEKSPEVKRPRGIFGALGGIRTPDLLVRSQALYPTELQAHFSSPKYVTTINRKNQPAIPKKIDRPKMLKKTQSSNPAARSISLSVTPKVRRYPATPPYFFSR